MPVKWALVFSAHFVVATAKTTMLVFVKSTARVVAEVIEAIAVMPSRLR